MRCPFCERTGTRPELHAHLTDDHAQEVITEQDSVGSRFEERQLRACCECHRQDVQPR